MRRLSLMLFLLILLPLFIGTGLAEDSPFSYQLSPESPTNIDQVSIVLDRVYDRIIVKHYENGTTKGSGYHFNTSQAEL